MNAKPTEHSRTGDPDTTGHEWDGIKEWDNPLPRWWLWTFYITILWAVGYWIAMPAWPLVRGYTEGVLGYSQRQAVAERLAAAQAAQQVHRGKLLALPLAEVRDDADLLRYALAGGKSAFAVNCSQCHGSGAAGSLGYPNLNDDDWLWGGKVEDIAATIRYGVRADHAKTRASEMVGFLDTGVLKAGEVAELSEHVLRLSGQPHDAAMAERGGKLFAEHCVACHGPQGGGLREQGAPNLTDRVWLYGGGRAELQLIIAKGRRGVMPAWGERLDEVTVRKLALFVHALGGGE